MQARLYEVRPDAAKDGELHLAPKDEFFGLVGFLLVLGSPLHLCEYVHLAFDCGGLFYEEAGHFLFFVAEDSIIVVPVRVALLSVVRSSGEIFPADLNFLLLPRLLP